MRGAWFLCAMLVPFAANSVFASGEWPQFLGPTHDCHTPSKGLPLTWDETKNVRWKTPLPGKGWSSPVIWDNQIWMTTATPDGREMFGLCVDRESGKLVHHFKVFDVEKPSEIHVLNSYASPSPVIEAGRVYLTWGSYGTACVDTTNGQILWTRRDLPCEHFRGPGSSPILHGNLLILHYDGFDFQYVVAMDKRTGASVWKVDRAVDYGSDNGDYKKAYCTPTIFTINGRQELISPTSKAALAYDPETGKELWRIRYDGFSATARPLFGRGLIFINSGFSKAELYTVKPGGNGDITDSHVVWKSVKGIPSKPTQLLIDDKLFMVHDGGAASCLAADTGEVLGQQRLGGDFSASPLVDGNGRIYFSDQKGKTTVVQAEPSLTVLAENTLEDGCMSSPAVAGNALFLRTRSALYRLEDSSAAP